MFRKKVLFSKRRLYLKYNFVSEKNFLCSQEEVLFFFKKNLLFHNRKFCFQEESFNFKKDILFSERKFCFKKKCFVSQKKVLFSKRKFCIALLGHRSYYS